MNEKSFTTQNQVESWALLSADRPVARRSIVHRRRDLNHSHHHNNINADHHHDYADDYYDHNHNRPDHNFAARNRYYRGGVDGAYHRKR
jgi:hypothetical protein